MKIVCSIVVGARQIGVSGVCDETVMEESLCGHEVVLRGGWICNEAENVDLRYEMMDEAAR